MWKRSILAGTALALALGLSIAARAAERPNIILIVLDDVGFSDLGPFGSEIRTPNIDALARDGLRYNRFDTKAVCTPTRAALLTGRNPQTVRMADLPADKPDPANMTKDRGELPVNAQTVAQVLLTSGYRTYGFGKWHLGPEYEDGTEGNNGSWPLQRGFDQFYGFYLGWTDQYRPKLIEGNRSLPDAPLPPDYHFSADIVDHTISALDKGDQEKPAFVYLAFGAAHSPIQAPRAYIDHYAGVYDQGWDALREQRLARMKAMGILPQNTVLPPRNAGDRAWDSLTPTEKKVFARFMEVYAGFIEHTDAQIGRLVAHLKQTGQYDNSLIMLVSDNGAASEAGQNGFFERMYRPNTLTPEQMLARIDELGTEKTQSEYPRPWAMAGVTPFRRYKVWPYLGGVRAPMIVSWPKAIRDGGGIRGQYVDAVDIAPTLVDAAGTRFPDERAGQAEIPVAGSSIRTSFTQANAPSVRDAQYFELRGNRAIRVGDWRAVSLHRPGTPFDSDCWELFNLAEDFSESRNLAGQHPEKLAELKQRWWREAGQFSQPVIAEMPERFARRERFDPADAQAACASSGQGEGK